MNQLFSFKYFRNVFLLVLLFSACSREVELAFEQPAAERIAAVISTCDSTLRASNAGWRVDYTTSAGYKAIFVMNFFSGDSVSMYMDTKDSIASSRYSFNYSQGPVLSFDTYSLLHSLADPQYNQKGLGYGADFEFIVNSVSSDSIVFTGKKNKDRVVFRKAIAGEINRVRLQSRMDFRSGNDINFFFAISNGTDNADVVVDYVQQDKLNIATVNGVQNLSIEYNADGFALTQPVQVGSAQVQNFNWNKAAGKFTTADNAFSILASNAPVYGFGATSAALDGNYYSVENASAGVFPWFYYLAVKYPQTVSNDIYFNDSVTVATKNIRITNGDTTLVSTDNQRIALTAYSFLIKDAAGNTTWNNFKAVSLTYPRADRVKLSLGVREGVYANDLNRDNTIKKLYNFLYDKNGLTVYPVGDVVYLVSNTNSKQWMALKKNVTEATQVKFNIVQ